MAHVIIPTKDQWDMLSEMGLFSDRGIILIHPDTAKKYEIVENDKRVENYNFGGEPDCWLDIVSSNNGFHCVLDLVGVEEE